MRSWRVVGLALLGPLLMLAHFYLRIGPKPLVSLTGILYPCYASMKAVASPEKSDDTRWLTYWVAFAAFSVLESIFLRYLLVIFPFWYAFKFGFLLWAQAPSTRGAAFLYSHVLAPFFKIGSVIPANPN